MSGARYRARWSPDDRAASIYQYVPFDVPAGALAVSVRLRYDVSRAVLDLGLFGPAGFRGYSGGARDRFVVAADAATPGYLAGPIETGEWRVLIGLHRVPPEGVEAELDIRAGALEAIDDRGVAFSPPAPSRPASRRDLPAGDDRRWLAGDLHAHTVHSDGALTIDQLADLARRRGLDVLAVTDHNTVSHHPHLAAAGRRHGVELIPGQEVTTDTGHANCFGDVGWVDFRRPSDDWSDHAAREGGLLSINHPLAGDCRWRRPLTRRVPLAEVWHSSWDRRSDAPLRWWGGWGGVAVGGSDWHRPGHALGCPTTWVEVGEDGDVLAALRAGHVTISAAPDGPVVLRHEGQVVVDAAAGLTLIDGDGRRRSVRDDRARLDPGPSPHVLVDDAGLVHALLG